MASAAQLPKITPVQMAIATGGLIALALLALLPMEHAIQIIGNASFAATFLSYAQSDMIRLRLIAIASLCMGLAYNSYVHLQMPEGQGIALVIFWLCVFLVQNIYKAVREVSQSIEAPLDPSERQIMVAAFPTMHSKDWNLLARNAQRRTLKRHEPILRAGDATSGLMLLAGGVAVERRIDAMPTLVRQSGTFWGELTWSLGRAKYNKSPCAVTVISESAEIWEWSYEDLEALTKDRPRMLAALRDGFLRSACFKHGLLQERKDDARPLWQSSPPDLAIPSAD